MTDPDYASGHPTKVKMKPPTVSGLKPTPPYSDDVYDVLVAECGARDTDDKRDEFAAHWPGCREFRFQGDLGYGGKVWWSGGRAYVTGYSEDVTVGRQAMIDRANERLATLVSLKPKEST